MSVAPWSFSRIKAFEQCPKQFYHDKVLKEFPFVETDATMYGTAFHKVCEEYIRDGVDVPAKFSFIKETLEELNARKGTKHCEIKMGLTEDLEACSFFDKKVWFRGIADLVIVDGDTATVIDYKTGKSAKYADKGQLELMALSVFKHFPEVKHVKAGLLFVVAKDLIKATYAETDSPKLWAKWLADYAKMRKAFEVNVLNPRPSGLCKMHCPVLECLHNGRG